MNKREARRIAYQIAYRFAQQALDGGGDEARVVAPDATDADQRKIDDAMDSIVQRLFELGQPK